MIALFRVDDRLLHGQVAFLWTKTLKVQTILIANTEILTDEFTVLSLNLAKPTGVNLLIESLDNAVEIIKSHKDTTHRVLVVVNSVKDAYYISNSVDFLESVNLGGIRERPGSKRFTNAVTLTDEDMNYCKKLIENNIEVEMRSVPDMKKKILNIKDIGG